MSALTIERMRSQDSIRFKQFTLKSGKKAFKGGIACVELASGQVIPAVSGVGLVRIGVFAETIDATSAAKLVNVDLEREVILEFFENDATTPVLATDVGKACFLLDDHTVTGNPASASIAGTVWVVDSARGIGVERPMAPMGLLQGQGLILQPGTLPAYAANDSAPTAAQIVSGAMYDVPATAAASTITLPAASPDGTEIMVSADGTKNGHTITYRDATGTVALTTALTASKRHLAVCMKQGGKWFANVYVGP